MVDGNEALHAAYRVAIVRFNEAVAALRKTADTLSDVSKSIRGKSGSFHVRPGYVPSVSTWPESLPERADLLAQLDEWHAAFAALKAAHEALGPDEQKLAADLPVAARDTF